MIGPHTHHPKNKPISNRRGEGGAERWGGPWWSPASCWPGSHLGGTRSHPPTGNHQGPPNPSSTTLAPAARPASCLSSWARASDLCGSLARSWAQRRM